MANEGRNIIKSTWNDLIYDIFLWFFGVVTDLFFREIHPRSSWKVPRHGPVIFVAAPHANQFVDPLILMRVLRQDTKRRIAFLIAEKSMRRRFVGWLARTVGSVPVGRALDNKSPAKGLIYLPDPKGDPTLVKGIGVDFTGPEYVVGGLIVLPSVTNVSANSEIKEILGPDELRLKQPFSGAIPTCQLTGHKIFDPAGQVLTDLSTPRPVPNFKGIKFSVAPRIDQSQVFDAVFTRLHEGGCVGIFPEGGSHDRTELLPLKAGVAIMALGALAKEPNCGVTIVPCGMNYFHAHKFRSRCVIECGSPVEIEPELVEKYKSGERREAVATLLHTVYQALVAVTVTSPDYDTLMLIQAVRRLYNPKGKKLPLPMVVELNRRLVKGYITYKDDPRIVTLKKDVLDYNKQLELLNIRDHQVSYAKFSWYKVVAVLIYRVSKLTVLSAAVLPGLALFSPVFIIGKYMSIRKAREALAASAVKIQAKDVMATWKLLVALALAPTLYTCYVIGLAYWTYRNRVSGRVPDWVPIWIVVFGGYAFFTAITFAALRFGEIGMDIAKSLRPLVLSINPTERNTLFKLRKRRTALVESITDIINELGPELYPDFDHQRIVSDSTHPLHSPTESRPGTPTHRRDRSELDSLSFTPESPTIHRSATDTDGGTAAHLPRNESFKNIGSLALFSTRPGTPNHSRSRTSSSGGFSFKQFAMSPVETKQGFGELKDKLHGAMRDRGRRRMSEEGGWEQMNGDEESTTTTSTDLEVLTPGSDLEPEDAKKDV